MSATSSSFHAATGESPRGAEFDSLFEEMCNQLREKASRLCRMEGSPIVGTGDLVNDVYLKLRRHPTYSVEVGQRNRLEFVWLATAAMRHVLTDAARKRHAGSFQFVPFEEAAEGPALALTPEQLIDLDTALTALEVKHPRQAAIITMRFYGGMSIRELQDIWALSDATVSRDIAFALKFLNALLAR